MAADRGPRMGDAVRQIAAADAARGASIAQPASSSQPSLSDTPSAALARVRASFARQGAMTLIGACLDEIRPGYCSLSLVPRPETSQQHGYVHAGILATLVDSAGGYAGYTMFPEDSSVLTVEFKLNLVAPAQGERIVAEGFVVKSGRTLTITRGDVHAEQDGKRTLVAIMQQTLMVMRGKADRRAEDRT